MVVFVSAPYVRNMQDGKTCIEAGYKDITSLPQCKSAFRSVPEHPKKHSSSDVSLRHCYFCVISVIMDGSFSSVLLLQLLICVLFPCPQYKYTVSTTRSDGGCLSQCFGEINGYFCRYWGSNAKQSKTDIKTDKSRNQYMLCVLPTSFDKYCARFTSCGQCSAHSYCGWCDNACVSKSKAGNCKSYTGRGQNCPVCAAAKSCDTCVSNPSCGWCHSRGDCSSVALYQPEKCEQRAKMPLQRYSEGVKKCSYCMGAVNDALQKVDANTDKVSSFCSGHGSCRTTMVESKNIKFRTLTQQCDCGIGYSGAGCDFACPKGCSGHGVCDSGACVCDCGYNGDGCELQDEACEGGVADNL